MPAQQCTRVESKTKLQLPPDPENNMPTVTTPSSSNQVWQFEIPAVRGIVVGFDGSIASHTAIESAEKLAAARKLPVHVVSVLRPLSSFRIDSGSHQPRLQIEDLRVQLRDADVRDAIGSAWARSGWTREVAVGNPSEEIGRVAEKRMADLIIVGRTDHGVIDQMFGGDTTLELMRGCSIPVLVVTSEISKPEVVVAAVDFGSASTRAAEIAVEMLGQTGTVYLVHVEHVIDVLPDGTVCPSSESYPCDLVARFRQLTNKLRAPHGVVVETVILNGSPVPTLLEFSERVGADLLVAGTHGLKGIQRLLLGSVSTALVRNSRKPLLVVPGKL
jgi:nucleotide-binding universal stress UspA family protein